MNGVGKWCGRYARHDAEGCGGGGGAVGAAEALVATLEAAPLLVAAAVAIGICLRRPHRLDLLFEPARRVALEA